MPETDKEPVVPTTEEPEDCELFGYQEIAELLGVKPSTVNMWRWGGKLPEPDGPDVHGMPTYRPETILAWAAETGRCHTQTAIARYKEQFGTNPPTISARARTTPTRSDA